MRLTENFTKQEFDSKDQSPMPAWVLENVKILAQELQKLRNYIKKNIKINSGYRSPLHNAKVGGAIASQHLVGKAADIRVEGVAPKQVYDTIEMLIEKKVMKEGGLGLYKTFVHYDIRGQRKRWNYSDIELKKKQV